MHSSTGASHAMRGWLSSREGLLVLHSDRYFFRLQWGFLTKHLTERSAAISRYCIHASRVSAAPRSRRICIELGSFGLSVAKESGSPAIRRVVLIADTVADYSAWVTSLMYARDRNICNWYQLREELGFGSDGSVLLARRIAPVVGGTVAVKRIKLSSREGDESTGSKLRRTFLEIQLQHKAARRSGSVAKIFDVFYDSHYCYIVMELADGGSLSALLDKRQGALPEAVVAGIVAQLGKCLLALHQSDIVHRDIKCDNVLIARTGPDGSMDVRLSDFGFAAVWRTDRRHSLVDFCRAFLGTETYIAPEIARRERYGAPADIYALGVLCHVCLLGKFPFEATTLRATLDLIKTAPLTHLTMSTTISPAALSFTKALLHRDPRKRPTAAALLQHSWLRGGPVTLAPRRRPRGARLARLVLRRAVTIISTVLALRAFASQTARRHGNRIGTRMFVPQRIASSDEMHSAMSEEFRDRNGDRGEAGALGDFSAAEKHRAFSAMLSADRASLLDDWI